MARRAAGRSSSMRMKNWSIARKMIGTLERPAVRVGVVDLALARERADLPEHFDDVRVGVEDVLADQFGHAAFLGEAAIVVDGREDGQTVLAADEVIVVAVAGGRCGRSRCRRRA